MVKGRIGALEVYYHSSMSFPFNGHEEAVNDLLVNGQIHIKLDYYHIHDINNIMRALRRRAIKSGLSLSGGLTTVTSEGLHDAEGRDASRRKKIYDHLTLVYVVRVKIRRNTP